MSARNARNVALIGLVVVAWIFAVETAFMGAVLQKRGAPQDAVQWLMLTSVASLLLSVLACTRAAFVFRRGAPTSPGNTVPAQRGATERAARVLVG